MSKSSLFRRQNASAQPSRTDDWARTHAPRETTPHVSMPAAKPVALAPESAQAPRSLEDQIRARAHEIYLERVKAGAEGSALGDWLKAERELRVRLHLPAGKPH